MEDLSLMRWNWQRPGWPDFTWKRSRFAKAETRFLLLTGEFLGKVTHLTAEDKERLTIESMSVEAIMISEIEGEILDRASVQSSIRRRLGPATDQRRAKPAEQGVAEMMVDLHRSFAEPLTDERLFAWHRMLLGNRRDLKDIGRYRSHDDPMQAVSGPIHAPKVHFEASPSKDVPWQMLRFIAWSIARPQGGTAPLPALTRAGIAHLYFEGVHLDASMDDRCRWDAGRHRGCPYPGSRDSQPAFPDAIRPLAGDDPPPRLNGRKRRRKSSSVFARRSMSAKSSALAIVPHSTINRISGEGQIAFHACRGSFRAEK